MLDVENQIVKIKVNRRYLKKLEEVGVHAKVGDIVDIPAKYLSDGSNVKVTVECSYCGKLFQKPWNCYLKTKDKICCYECKTIKMMEVSFAKYGNVCSLKNPEVAKKRKATWDLKYGEGKNPLSCDTIREKAYETMYEKYGTYHKSINTSKQQIYICELYHGELNYNIGPYIVDMLISHNVVVEYDGSGHDMSVRMGQVSKEEFYKKEEKRERGIINSGYKIVRISYMNKKDKLPDDKILLGIMERAFMVLNKGYSIYTYDLKTRKESFNK